MAADALAFNGARPGVAIVGAGAMGRALALRLADRGYPILAVLSRTRSKAEALGRAAGTPVASDRLFDLPPDARLVLICVGDDAIGEVAASLAGVQHPWRETVAAHLSGALPAAALDSLAREGAAVLSFHPLQTISGEADARTLDGAYVGLEGDPKGVATGTALAVGLGLRPVVLTPDDKPRYHLAATLAANFLVTLVGMVQEVLASLGLSPAAGFALVAPLLRGTLGNLDHRSPEEALTGPVVRGDLETLQSHGRALRQHLPQLIPAYAALTVETVRLAVRSGRLDPARAEEVLTLMQQLVTPPSQRHERAPQAEPSGPRPVRPGGT